MDHVRRDGSDEQVTTANKIRLQDEMMRCLQEVAREDTAVLMSQPNVEGKTPQACWRRQEICGIDRASAH